MWSPGEPGTAGAAEEGTEPSSEGSGWLEGQQDPAGSWGPSQPSRAVCAAASGVSSWESSPVKGVPGAQLLPPTLGN